MASKSEHLSAQRQFYADCARPQSAREACEAADDAVGVLVDEWTEKLMRNGDVPRVYAVRCAEAVVGVLRARDRACGEGAAVGSGLGSGVDGRGEEQRGALCRGLREIGVRIFEASKETRRMQAGALVLAAGSVHERFDSARELAERTGTSHELAANAVEGWQEALGLPRNSGQKSERARQVYQGTNGKLGRKAA